MNTIAYNATMQQFNAAVKRAEAHCKLASAIKARWPLVNARFELDEAQMFLALARAEVQRK